ncbi:O-succinylhomoserine sulfhydrylase [Pelagibacterium halotolerans]|uniref:O-succinylhomoserine sulfhydrylase n=1 Tax=Pelagibacterium halotolerans (strain DSM 22347 / JCM 15775 / CGMCC 1.7692 / B2) TaxID=1082931 RepID=G4R8T5_PELHB|nr:O-succinylhomoserine sulfhydrylase [Pelagibacterium halotolerans]AEQ50371.1 O-acetylhomoserine sulfhydrylase / O-succinylhomoserine sulfhydrylase [Pelagibacterium halotolerans B2]QJR19651.1 O-succinylhomoserine sulfhydrylase [Pelagibacterium halotolerans]SDZ85639.1 O-succinylhomoserine sulfhydrylase [Pelagibacterium halotolerans]
MSDKTSNPLFDPKRRKAQTMLVHGGMERSQHGETSEAIFFNSGFVYPTSGGAEARFKGEEPGHIYSRFSNPTVEMFQQRAALLEGAEAARATATGMAAVTTAVMSQLRAGDHVVAARALFGGCRFVIETYMPRWGVESSLVDGRDPENFARAMKPNTKVVFVETPTNPTLELVDIKAVAEIAHAHGAVLIVDNVFATPVWQKPLELGADLVTYSATKHIDGQGRAMGGLILGRKELIEADVHTIIRQTGPSISPFNAWVLLKGLETLPLRVKAMTESAAKIADFLADHPKVDSISYPFHPSHPQYELAKRQMGAGSTLVAFTPKGSKQAAFALADALAVIAISNNLGDAKSIISHPATTTHQRFTPEEKIEMDITDGLLRLSVGLEDADDLIADLSFALEQV